MYAASTELTKRGKVQSPLAELCEFFYSVVNNNLDSAFSVRSILFFLFSTSDLIIITYMQQLLMYRQIVVIVGISYEQLLYFLKSENSKTKRVLR